GICIGCTMPGFPDKFSPIYSTPPGSLLSSNTSRVVGGFIRRMRRVAMQDKNRTARWEGKQAPSGWARYQKQPTGATKLIHKLYNSYQKTKVGS
ncbi:MAG: hydrogenase expression protein HypE, partial [Actinomycetota bacterium]|nr:hydrogenase expression protein HypE [Actinomycetota bacterium]